MLFIKYDPIHSIYAGVKSKKIFLLISYPSTSFRSLKKNRRQPYLYSSFPKHFREVVVIEVTLGCLIMLK